MKILATIIALLLSANLAYAAETVTEKAAAEGNNMKRSMTRKAHRVDEKICDKTDKNCLPKKANNRAKEAKEYAKDKKTEAVNAINDND